MGQPIGAALSGWQTRPRPPRSPIVGNLVSIEPVDPGRHADDIHGANAADTDGRMWTYMGYGPFATPASYRQWMEATCLGEDPLFHAIVDRRTGKASGLASYLRIEPAQGVIEIGHIALSPLLQRKTGASEAMYLMMARVFDELGYRRYEWKCDALNEPSRRAALRLGFSFEGIFRQHMIYKGRNRDTAWFAVTDGDWPLIKRAFQSWLSPENFDIRGQQRQSLAAIRESLKRT